ncbi:MAG: hypothetical protein K0R24_1110 [Gammaproteobacteria bacterium]|jgi:hypothetical protein|nr:hypothetical protein [Gammaproteobacteria bacterium]
MEIKESSGKNNAKRGLSRVIVTTVTRHGCYHAKEVRLYIRIVRKEGIVRRVSVNPYVSWLIATVSHQRCDRYFFFPTTQFLKISIKQAKPLFYEEEKAHD